MNSNIQVESQKHNMSLISRQKLDIEGVIDILEFDNNAINIKTTMGVLSIEGDRLKIVSMSKETGKIFIEGRIDSLFYYDAANERKNGFFKRRDR